MSEYTHRMTQLKAINTLRSRGWTVTVTGGY